MEEYKVIFISNFFNHHQKPLSEELFMQTDGSYLFIETAYMSSERKSMGWGMDEMPSYVVTCEMFLKNKNYYQHLIDFADIVIIGNASDILIKSRKKTNSLVFRYSERFYKKGCPYWQIPLRYIKNHMRFHKNEYLLCASAYTAADASLTCNFLKKTYKWGYFTEVIEYDIDNLINMKAQKETITILWVARFIDWKHPEIAVLLADKLKNAGYSFKLQMIGNGIMEDEISRMIREYELVDRIEMLGPMKPEAVRNYMEQSDIFLFTSDFNEGWGAVANEAMNSGCAVVASHAIGAVPFLIKDDENGLIYKNGDLNSLYTQVSKLLDNKALRLRLGREAYSTMCNLWNPKLAASRFLELSARIRSEGTCNLFSEGPCSRAEVIKNDWLI